MAQAKKALKPISQNTVFINFRKGNSTPKLDSILHITKSFVQSEINRKHKEACFKLMSVEQKKTFTELPKGTKTLKEFFVENNIPNFPAKGEHQAEMKIIKNGWAKVDNDSKKRFSERLADINEKRDSEIVFGEVFTTYQNNQSNTWKHLLD